jgi:hypothetical protein
MEETPQQSPARKRSWFARHKVLTALLVLIGLGVIGSATGGGNSSQTSQKSSPEPSGKVAGNATSEPVKSGAPSTPAAKAESYQQILTFSGNGSKKSEPFKTTGDRFKVKYDCKGDLCQAFLYSTSSDAPKEVLMNAQGAVKDETVVYGAGEYYIQANTIGTYTMTVEDHK